MCAKELVAASVVALFAVATPCRAADSAITITSKGQTFDWSGGYVGTELGYAAGSSDWSAAPAIGPGLRGSIGLAHGYDPSTGDGSYFCGLVAGYSYVLPSRLLVGVEGDISFPNSISGSQTVSSAITGSANYDDTVLLLATARGRIGYAFDRWLVYGTGGFALSRDQLDRTQLSGAGAGSTDAEFLTRLGMTAGAGMEVGLTPKLSAKLEYRFYDFPSGGIFFPPVAQHYDSDLMLNTVLLGLNYKLGSVDEEAWSDEAQSKATQSNNWALHGQTTYVWQYDPPFHSPYVGPQSLKPDQARETWSATLYAGVRLWNGAEVWVDPEIDQGFGLQDTHGIAGFVSGEAYKTGADYPYVRLSRYFIRQTIDLGGETEKIEPDANQFGGSYTTDRLVITIGKWGVADADVKGSFDANEYAHEPRTDFLNWSLIDTGTFDYAADAWGFTYGAMVEWYKGPWTLRGGMFDLSIAPNTTELDPDFSQFQWDGEIERRYELWQQPGKIAITGFLSRGRMGLFEDAIQLSEATGQPADIAAVRNYRSRGGIGLNLQQQLAPDIGVFLRAGVADGNVEPFDFTDIDQTVAGGFSIAGKRWGRPDDIWGIGGVINGISNVHEAFFNDGGLGILVGDGKLPHPGPEQIIETYYRVPLAKDFWFTPDYQFIANPAYNTDRGPVSVIGARLHAEF